MAVVVDLDTILKGRGELLQFHHEMPIDTGLSKVTVDELVERFRGELVPLGHTFSYFSAIPTAEEDLKQYLHEPIGALPPAICAILPKVAVVLVPYLEKGNGKDSEAMTFEKPPKHRHLMGSKRNDGDQVMFFFAIKDEDVSEYHYCFYNAIASLAADRWPAETQEAFTRLLREEFAGEVHGEVDERSWNLKQSLLRRMGSRKEGKPFKEYARQAFMDTLTLYLHGICCDIDVETGPRQMPSRYLRKRLETLHALFPPPQGMAVFPEQMNRLS